VEVCSGFPSHQLCVSALSGSDHKERFRQERHRHSGEPERGDSDSSLPLQQMGERANESPARGSWTDIRGFL